MIDRETGREVVCNFCELAPAKAYAKGKPACEACADSVRAFYRGELSKLPGGRPRA